MAELSKLQIRARVLSVVSRIKTVREYNEDLLKKLYSELEDIEDRHCVFDVFLKEYIKMNEREFVFAGCLLKELVDVDYIQNSVFEFLKSSNYSDEAKYKLVQLLRITECEFDYDSVPEYFENPSDVIDSDTKKLLEKAVFNPEAMLDFLDFVSAVNKNDRNLLLQSLQLDYHGDSLANIVYPILYSDFDDDFKLKASEILIEAKSSLAIEPFKYIIETSSNEELINTCRVGLKKLKLSGATEQKAKEYFADIVKSFSLSCCYTTMPDGSGNQAFIISRENVENKKFMLIAVVVNDIYGVEDCFGFYNISKQELSKIVDKFYNSEGQYKITPAYIRTRLNEAYNLTIKNKNTFPYEFVCWDALLKDIAPLPSGVEKEVEKSADLINIKKNDLLMLLTKEYSFRWYLKPGENAALGNILDEINNANDLEISYINNLILEREQNVFDEKTLEFWKQRILQCVYLLCLNDKKEDADAFYSMLKSEDGMHIFKMVLMQRSIFNYFFSVREAAKEMAYTTNIFKKKKIEKEKIDVKKIESILNLLSINWIDG